MLDLYLAAVHANQLDLGCSFILLGTWVIKHLFNNKKKLRTQGLGSFDKRKRWPGFLPTDIICFRYYLFIYFRKQKSILNLNLATYPTTFTQYPPTYYIVCIVFWVFRVGLRWWGMADWDGLGIWNIREEMIGCRPLECRGGGGEK